MKDKLLRFMQGRYGTDHLSKFMMIVGLVFLFIASIFPNSIVYLISLLLIIISYIRIFSKDHQKRYKENQWFLKHFGSIYNIIPNLKRKLNQTKQYHIYKCPNCKQKIRVPRGKGKIEIKCQKCSTKFIKNS
jgi:DNA-directed RNA polymerase subunit RPC12/RpoP